MFVLLETELTMSTYANYFPFKAHFEGRNMYFLQITVGKYNLNVSNVLVQHRMKVTNMGVET